MFIPAPSRESPCVVSLATALLLAVPLSSIPQSPLACSRDHRHHASPSPATRPGWALPLSTQAREVSAAAPLHTHTLCLPDIRVAAGGPI